MSVTDKIGNEIEVGSFIIYSNVGTIGKVLDIQTDESITIDKYDLSLKLKYAKEVK